MRRGTEVGRAYVKGSFDGDGMNEQIVQSVDEAGPGVERAGEDHGERYGEGFEVGSEGRLSKYRQRAAKAFSDRFASSGDDAGEGFARRMEGVFDRVGDRLGERLGSRIANSLGGQLEETLARLIDTVETSVSGNGGGRGSVGGTADNLGPPPIEVRRLEQAYRMDQQYDRTRTRMLEMAYRMNAAFDRRIFKEEQDRIQRLGRMQEMALRMNAKFEAGRLDGQGYAIPGGGGSDRGLGDRIGIAFGAGSRNNFLNAFGKSLGGAITLTDKLRKSTVSLFGVASRGLERFRTGFAAASASGDGLIATMGGLQNMFAGAGGGLTKLFSTLAASGPAAAVAVGVLVVALSALASVVSALIALTTALAAAIAGALTGALAVFGAGVTAVVASVGLLTAAFMSMTDAQKNALKEAFTPLRQEMIGIGQIMLQQMTPAFQTWSTNLQNALMLVVPVAQQMGAAFAQAGNTITASLSGPGFRMFSESLATYLPSIIGRLSSALGSFLNGALALFSALMPYVNQFAGYLDRVATKFANWATSATGQNAIEDFMARAVASIRSVWDFVTQFVGYIGDVLFNPTSMAAGNSIFDSLARSFEGFRADFARAAADGSLKKWFDDAIKFGKDLGATIATLTKVFKDLYNSGTLESVGTIMKNLAGFIDKVVTALGPLLDALGWLLPKTLKISLAPLNALLDVIVKIGDGISWVFNKIRGEAKATSDYVGQVQSGLKGMLSGDPNIPGAGAGNPISDLTGGAMKNLPQVKTPSLPDLKFSGANALAGTNLDKGAGAKAAKKFKNPYLALANSILKDAPTVAASIKNALRETAEQVSKAINEAMSATGGASVTSSLTNLAESITSSAEQVLNTANQAVQSAAQSLASASSMKAAKKALRELKNAQKSAAKAQADQERINRVSDILTAQAVVTESNVLALVSGNLNINATLADFAEARARVADKIAEANQKLAEAIQLRDSYQEQIASSIQSFGSLITAQAKTLNGVQQALTSGDIVGNLQDRLAKIRKFQENLRLLLAQGITQDVYRQLVEAGVEGGSAYTEALLAGGPGAISEVNQLVGQINAAGDAVGAQAADRLYQAGVDGAQALLDGLTSLQDQLVSAGTTLGTAIGNAITAALGLSVTAPSSIGGTSGSTLNTPNTPKPVIPKGGAILGTPSNPITPTKKTGLVAGRSVNVEQLTIITPTEDPHAVAVESMNELLARI